ncbi:uncharacterized protein LOC144886133 [Branchiostoma floridae x Branchiostoma japonicum]
MVKICCYGTCNSDTRYPERVPGVRFYPFPKPKTKFVECLRWIKACGRPNSQLNVSKVTKHSYVCSKHFVDGRPTERFPDPIPADGSAVTPKRPYLHRAPHLRCMVTPLKRPDQDFPQDEENCRKKIRLSPPPNNETPSTSTGERSWIEHTPKEGTSAAACSSQNLESQNETLKKENEKLKEQVEQLASQQLQHLVKEQKQQKKQQTMTSADSSFCVDAIVKSPIKNLLRHYTGFTFATFMMLFSFLVPNESENPVVYHEKKSSCMLLPLKDQMLLVLCRLRNGFHLKDLGFRFNVSAQVASVIFNSWITYMYHRLGYLCLWPSRDVLVSKMTTEFRKLFPTTIAMIDCTELKTDRPSSLKTQSQCFSDYKSSTTLKALVVTDSRGSFMFSTNLFSGSISDKDICKQGGFYDLLSDLMSEGKLKPGDAIMADKGFVIDKELEQLGLRLNIPPFSSSSCQMCPGDVNLTRKIASQRVHIERAINRIKNFKLVCRRIPASLFGNINEIWLVCCYLSTFHDMLVRDTKS